MTVYQKKTNYQHLSQVSSNYFKTLICKGLKLVACLNSKTQQKQGKLWKGKTKNEKWVYIEYAHWVNTNSLPVLVTA